MAWASSCVWSVGFQDKPTPTLILFLLATVVISGCTKCVRLYCVPLCGMDDVVINQVVRPLSRLAELELQHPAVAESLTTSGPRSSS